MTYMHHMHYAERTPGYSHGGADETNDGWFPYPTVVKEVIMKTKVFITSQSLSPCILTRSCGSMSFARGDMYTQ